MIIAKATGGGVSLPVVDETAIVYKTGNTAITQIHNIDAYTVARIISWPNAAGTVPLLETAQTFTDTNTFNTPDLSSQAIIIKDTALQSADSFLLLRSDNNEMVGIGRGPDGNGAIRLHYPTGPEDVYLYADGAALTIDTGETATFRMLPFANDIYFQNTVSSGNIYFTGNAGARLTGNANFLVNTIINTYEDSGTNNTQYPLILVRNSSGTPAANFAGGILCRLESSTSTNQNAAAFKWKWTTATHATRAAQFDLTAYYTSTERTVISGGADSSGPLLGVLGATPVARPTITGSRGGNAALADLLTKLATSGYITDSTSA